MTRGSTHGLDVVSDERGWREFAACRDVDPDVMFPEWTSASWSEAKAICRRCTVTRPCLKPTLELSDTNDQWGVRGGYTPDERQQIRRCYQGKCEHERHQK